MKTLPVVLIDGSSFIYRAYHAVPPHLTSDGFPTGAIRGVVGMVSSLLRKYLGHPMAEMVVGKRRLSMLDCMHHRAIFGDSSADVKFFELSDSFINLDTTKVSPIRHEPPKAPALPEVPADLISDAVKAAEVATYYSETMLKST